MKWILHMHLVIGFKNTRLFCIPLRSVIKNCFLRLFCSGIAGWISAFGGTRNLSLKFPLKFLRHIPNIKYMFVTLK
ncbi:hypothetical protein Y032_0043g861 [Ancylostoma ceylanicum]|uniref:Uncharacterized protein n=1 Tax=Ancylostoma ceylanicum TaxID=53326 RepID=A0A016UFJ0_9BILA|nr:hypothetical protein Y032_0043g861 [Ancylostoma ceylanicum]